MSPAAAGDLTVVTSQVVRGWPIPTVSGDKNDCGRVLVVGGNEGMPGGVLLAAEAAMRAGAGKIQIATVESVRAALGVRMPEAYVAGLPADTHGDIAPAAAEQVVELAARCDTVLLGPGCMDPEGTAALLAGVVPHLDATLVIDALGMAYLTDHLDGLGDLGARTVLSPNVTELFTTLGEDEPEDVDGADGMAAVLAAARRLASATGAVVLTGAATSYTVRADGATWQDDTGGQGLAVSGSGDVKAGLVTGFLAQRMAPEQAAVWADFVHGRCGERLAAEYGQRGFLARDLLPRIPQVCAELVA